MDMLLVVLAAIVTGRFLARYLAAGHTAEPDASDELPEPTHLHRFWPHVGSTISNAVTDNGTMTLEIWRPNAPVSIVFEDAHTTGSCTDLAAATIREFSPNTTRSGGKCVVEGADGTTCTIDAGHIRYATVS